MKLKRILWVIPLLTICLFLWSCDAADTSAESGTAKVPEKEKISPAEYTAGDLTYSLTLSDGKRTVTLDVVRSEGVTEAHIVSPEAMSSVSVIWDAGGLRLIPESGGTLALTEESAAGLRAFFEAMAHPLSDSEKKNEGMYRFELSGYEAELLLSADGYPKLISLTKNGSTRHGEVRFPEKDGATS